MQGAVVTVGTFDGVHRGHQAVLAEIVRRARSAAMESVVVTFDPHPLAVVNPAAAPHLLTLPVERQRLLEQSGVSRVVTLAFTPELSRLTPEAFVHDVLQAQIGLGELVLGHDHGFGRGRSGDVETVRRIGTVDGFAVDVVEPVRDDGRPISSTAIRAAIAHGDLNLARRWLGRPYGALGQVTRGAGRGRTIGVPTINLPLPDARKLLPPDGVYAVTVMVEGRGTGAGGRVTYGGMMNQGSRPTFGVTERALEVHLFDFDGDLYGEQVWVEWVQRLRDVRTFPSRAALIEQLTKDRAAARDSLHRAGIG